MNEAARVQYAYRTAAVRIRVAHPISRSTCVKPEDFAAALLYRGSEWRNLRRGCWMLRSKRDLKLLSTQIEREPNLVGTWINELGSRMQIDSVDDGLISGTYWSKVSAEDDPVCGDLTGMVAGDTIGFAVNWRPTFNSVTSWSGKLLRQTRDTPTSSPYGTYRTTSATLPTGGNPSWPVPIRSGSNRMPARTSSPAPKPDSRQTLVQVVKMLLHNRRP